MLRTRNCKDWSWNWRRRRGRTRLATTPTAPLLPRPREPNLTPCAVLLHQRKDHNAEMAANGVAQACGGATSDDPSSAGGSRSSRKRNGTDARARGRRSRNRPARCRHGGHPGEDESRLPRPRFSDVAVVDRAKDERTRAGAELLVVEQRLEELRLPLPVGAD